MSKEIIQIEPWQAIRMIEHSFPKEHHEEVFSDWKGAGYIKKSALEEAREYTDSLLFRVGLSNHKLIKEVACLYEKAIEELQGENK